ncbi:ABC transporter ATP-binding protein [Salinispora sp. H7-4]|uniref:ABC transporter ATP-binding protein n=1 Tax=Salinispora sp. H7-4 TaxID=2748321 RepID=UPI0015D2B3B5|nr:ABC transporter ATP-binding protein [Salinispora sp. H7-4]NYT94351.1 ABC transporter ATP-binding protein [Salinispora sp. H7-4]
MTTVEQSEAVEAPRNPDDHLVLDVRDLRMRYGTVDVLNGIDLTAQRGEVIALLGPNGAGKTTIIEILEGFRLPSAGSIRVLGVDPARGDERWRAQIGVVLQSWRDHGRWRVRDLLSHLGDYYAPYATDQIQRPWPVDDLLAAVGLTAHANARVSRLSGGQRRRLDVAVGIVGRPGLLFLDEPTVGLDPAARREFHELVHRLADLDHTTILLTTHDLAEAEKLADLIVILANGRIIARGSPDQLSRRLTTDAEIRWTCDGQRHVHATMDATGFLRDLLRDHGDRVQELEVRRANLEDAYLALVHEEETGIRTGWAERVWQQQEETR